LLFGISIFHEFTANSTSVLPVSTSWLYRFALLTAITTFGLIGVGGLVTSHEAGMAVPDWPNTYGYNMFLFPISKWMGGIFLRTQPPFARESGWAFDHHPRGLVMGP